MLNQHVSIFSKGFKKGLIVILSYMIIMPFLVSAQNFRSAPSVAPSAPTLKPAATKKTAATAPKVLTSPTKLTSAAPASMAPADNPVPADIPASTATTSAAPATKPPLARPGLASGYINPYIMGMNRFAGATASMGTKAFFSAVERINKPHGGPSDSTKTPVGSVGIGLHAQSGGAVMLSLTKKTRWGATLP